jgi:membrane protein required for colicin V production
MNSVDIAILIVFGISCLAGFMRGFTREILGLFTWFGSTLATYMAVPLMGGIARGHIANPMIADAVTAVVLFIIFLIIFSLISGAVSNSVKRSNLGSIDRALGVSFGIVRAVVIVCSIEILFSTFTLRPNQSSTIQMARFTPMIRRAADNLIIWLPQNVREFIATQQSESMSKTQPNVPTLNPKADSLENILANAAQNIVTDSIINNQSQAVQNFLSPNQPTPSHQSQTQPNTVVLMPPKTSEDTEKTAESLANLTPQAMDVKGNDGDYNKRQRRDLDRLVQINQ